MARYCTFVGLIALVFATGQLFAQRMSAGDVNRLPSSPITLTAKYGSDSLQAGDLRMPKGAGPFPVVVVIHGGCWVKGFATRQNTAALASALTEHGFATWNIEYRQLGDSGGGWPGSFQDWATATDYLRILAKKLPLQLDQVSAIGHSAGAYAAIWVASRLRLPMTSEVRGRDPLPLRAAVAIDGPAELQGFIGPDAEICGKPVVEPLMGGSPEQRPVRYKDASPAEHLPLGASQLLIASIVLTGKEADAYQAKGTAAGDRIDVLKMRGAGHFDIIAPGSEAWKTVEPRLLQALADAGTHR